MAVEDARIKAGLKTAEDELNLIKNQVQQTLLDIREHILDATNPFHGINDALTDEDEIEFDDLMGGGAGAHGAAGAAGADGTASEGREGDDEEDVEDLEGGDGDSGEELLENTLDDPGEEIVEEIPDDGYIDEEIIDDGASGGMTPGLSDPEAFFEEEEEIPEEIEEEFELDEEPPGPEEDSESEGSENGLADTDGVVDGVLAPLTANLDVLTMAGLVRWVAITTSRIGANRTEIMLDAFGAAGRIAPSTRVVLHHLMALTEEDPEEPVPVRDIVSAMVRMEGVLDIGTGSDSTRLLSMVMDVDDDPLDLLSA